MHFLDQVDIAQRRFFAVKEHEFLGLENALDHAQTIGTFRVSGAGIMFNTIVMGHEQSRHFSASPS